MLDDGITPEVEAERIALRRNLRAWRDRWSIEIEIELVRLCRREAKEIAPWAAGLRAYRLAAARGGMVSYPALPDVVARAAELATQVLDSARAELATMVARHLAIEVEAGRAEAAGGLDSDTLLAIGRGVAPLAAAGALLAALPTLATTTTVTMFGLIATSSVSLPLLAAGAAGVGVLGYLGAINMGDLRAGQERLLVEAIDVAIETRLLVPEGTGGEPSLLAQAQAGLASAAADMIRTIG